MKRKLVLALTLIAMLAALMSGCGSADKEENSTDKQTETSDNTSDKEEIHGQNLTSRALKKQPAL